MKMQSRRDHRALIVLLNEGAKHLKSKDWPAYDQAVTQVDTILSESLTLSPHSLRVWQLRAAADLCSFSIKQIPFYSSQNAEYQAAVNKFIGLGKTLMPNTPPQVVNLAFSLFQKIPILTRSDVQNRMTELVNPNVREEFREKSVMSSSGSTGRPMESPRSSATFFFFSGMERRFERLHDFPIDEPAAFIRQPMSQAAKTGGAWSKAGTGKSISIDLMLPHSRQLDELKKSNAAFLVTFPSNLRKLLKVSAQQVSKPKKLKLVCLMAETVPAELLSLCESQWGVRTCSTYSSTELGPMAYSLPKKHGVYNIASENVLLEILDEQDQPVAPGQTGRVVATSLIDPLRPLIRYAIGDYAVACEEAPFGQQIGTIVGRSRNLFIRRDGSALWPYFKTQAIAAMPEVNQWKLIQTTIGQLNIELVLNRPLSEQKIQTIRDIVLEHLPKDTEIIVTEVSSIERSKSGKFEDFECRVPNREN